MHLAFAILLFLISTPGALAQNAPAAWMKEWPETDFKRITVDVSEIDSNISRDSIPSIDNPRFVALRDVEIEEGGFLVGTRKYARQIRQGDIALSRREPVISFVENGDARAYPLRILMFHEIVNDVVGGRPVAITYCPLCNAAVVFERRLEGQPVEFGTTGKLRRSDLIMYDRTSFTWWQQFTGKGLVGRHAGSELVRLPARLESLEFFARRFPEGSVLMPDEASSAPYGKNPYLRYDTASRPFLYRGGMPEGIKPLARVVAVGNRAYALSLLQEKGVIEENGYRLTWSPGQASALDTESIPAGRDVGNVIVEERGPDGQWSDAPYDVTFAFTYHAFRPDGVLVK